MMKQFILTILVTLSCVLTAYGNGLKPGKYILSAPALYSEVLSDEIHKSDAEFYSEIRPIKNHMYRLKLLNGTGNFFDFQINNFGKIDIIKSRFNTSEYGKVIKGSGNIVGKDLVQGKMSAYTGAVFWNRSTSEWFLRPATQKEIDENLEKGLRNVITTLRATRRERTKENIIKALGGGGNGYSGLDIPKIKKMLQSGQIEYKGGEFIIHREDEPEEEPIKPDISPEFQKKEMSRQEVIDAFKKKAPAVSKIQKTAAASPKASKPGQPSAQKPAQPSQELPKMRTSGRNYALIGLIALLGAIMVLGVVVYIRRKRQ